MTILLLILYALCTSCIVAKNVTIDDTYGDELTGVVPIYTPAQNWGDATCGGCLLKPDPSQAFDGTWHDSTFDAVWRPGTPTINMTFNGTASAIYVFCILGNLGPFNATTSMQLVFTLDGQPAGGFNYAPNNKSQEFMFNVPVYSNTSLAALPADTLHNLIIQSFMANLFDYAVYTLPDENNISTVGAVTSPTTPPSSEPTIFASVTPTAPSSPRNVRRPISPRVLAGAITGGISALLIVLACAHRCARRRARDVAEMRRANSVAEFAPRTTMQVQDRFAPDEAGLPLAVEASMSMVDSEDAPPPYQSIIEIARPARKPRGRQ